MTEGHRAESLSCREVSGGTWGIRRALTVRFGVIDAGWLESPFTGRRLVVALSGLQLSLAGYVRA
ncbi:MAG TPA: hypothetical protein VK619_01115 [Pyrinomonadaceae bacterium]|nr:hypothetical protein [Pyrinomonadaceae bacterium]